ncbi:MAG: hypothetical protein FJ009_15095 [Chloroflexi bacterium]|nr:hypothetical protein [Chloroflexota bacterium]
MGESKSWWSSLWDFLAGLFRSTPPPPTDTGELMPLQPRVLMIVYNPIVDPATGAKLIAAMRWNDPDQLAAGYIADVRECSGGLVNYQIAQKIEVDALPAKKDGFRYTPQEYVTVIQTHRGAHDPDAVDYDALLAQFSVLPRVTAGEIDEVWLFGGPYFGFWEAAMGGAGAFFCNGGPLANTAQCPRKFVVMGFNYERGIGEMLEDIGHRAEAILARVFKAEEFLQWTYTRGRSPATTTGANLNLFERFLCFDQIAPSKSNIGTIHYAPNSQSDYEWGITTPVQSCADDWKQFPDLPAPPNYRVMDTRAWGGGDIRAHHKWWLAHLPKVAGATNGIAHNWWKYVIQLNDPIFRDRL